ncbi:ABC transporter substrate-binding protein [Bifidobacterium angulatum]|uniref:ABC transporter, substrate-binding protein, family 5 n=1 Tax=Bifidobacterium angulatum DSM 20098 = JCM 7096 TaxID=518635 RepID=C4FE81_9BIFI|nr:ABC transporter substrate-binding protein [Bifidobacterium angulatum]AMK57877.1 peptide ABC transporter substrate-binding protein [Bifidobacterium angulatum]EEP21262.1 ABC transporter, substrate-binding protein, family 5 [Bifidobacterium angulatum DSM 20098 = JCM 7096]KFI38823.1 ABC transporter, solute-binding protein [Bifidobacterium angulatum]MEE0333181.1 ABC transporter substrate-binding protein [Bifidobacterium angulatum]BAQ96169.1 ABC transporter substrate binding component [Bifidobact
MNAKKIMAAAVSVAAIASLAACGGVKDDATAGNAITIGTTDKITSLDPAGSYDNGSYAAQIQVFPFLYAQDYNTSELSADIAADDGTWNSDGTQFTVKLKSGLKFANGHDLTSSDVKFSFDRVKKINDENGPSSLLANITDVKAKDDTTVVFTDSVPYDVTLKQVLSSPAGPIVDEESFSDSKLTDADTIVKDNAFAGPYKLTSFKLNEALAYAKNDSYKGLTPAKNDAVQVKYYADASNLKMAVQQGQIDVAYRSLTPTDISDLSKDKKVKVVTGPGGEERFLTFNFRIQPYGEKTSEPNAAKAKAVRQAVANLIDRDELASKVYKNTYTPMYSFIPDGLTSHSDTLKSAYGDGNGKPSTDKAKKVLSDAGVKTPVDLKLQYNPDHYGSSSADEYAAIKSQLESSGLFKVDLQSTEWTQFNKDRVVTEDSDGSYPVYQLGWFPDYSDPDNYLSPFFRDGNFVNNGYSNKEINDLIVKQAGEKDESVRENLLKEIQEKETDDLSTIPLLQGAQTAVTGTSVKGVVLDASFRFRYASITK